MHELVAGAAHALAFQPHHRAGIGALGNIQHDGARNGRHFHALAKRCLLHAYGQVKMDIITLPAEEFVRFDADFDIGVSGAALAL